MNQFRKKPIVIEATQWFKNGDHPDDASQSITKRDGSDGVLSEGRVVRYYRNPEDDGKYLCDHSDCGATMHKHGWIDTLEGGHIVCPGDWVVTGVKGERYPVKDEIFCLIYEAVDDAFND